MITKQNDPTMSKEILKKERSKKEVSYLLTILFTFVVFLCSCEPEELLQVQNSEASAKISGVGLFDFADTMEVDTAFVDTIREESLLGLYGLPPVYAKQKPEVEQPQEASTEEDEEKEEKEDAINESEVEDGDITEVESPESIVESNPIEGEASPVVYIHVKWGCNGNDSVIELIEEHNDNAVFDGISYEWLSDNPFSNSINTSNYALLSYIEPEVGEEYIYDGSLTITTNTIEQTFDFCFSIVEGEIINCEEEESMMATSCGVGLQSVQAGLETDIVIAFKAGKSSCYFFPVKPPVQD